MSVSQSIHSGTLLKNLENKTIFQQKRIKKQTGTQANCENRPRELKHHIGLLFIHCVNECQMMIE